MGIVFCTFCRWYSHTQTQCEHPKNYADSWKAPQDHLLYTPMEKNSKNNCNWYEEEG